jgi:CHAD domain-containing protein
VTDTPSPGKSLEQLARAWRRDRRKVLDRPEPEAIHRLRTTTRRLTVAVTIARSDLRFPASIGFDRWKELDRGLSRLRDLDVLGETLAEARAAIPRPAVKILDSEIERIDRKRRRARRRVIAALDRRSVGRVIDALVHAAKRTPPRNPVGGATSGAARWWRREGSRLARARGWAITVERSKAAQTALHRLRTNARALRYGLEWWSGIGAAIVPGPIDLCRQLQVGLGRVRDLDRALDVVVTPSLAAAAAYLRAERRSAIEAWRLLRERRETLARPATASLSAIADGRSSA